MQAKLNPQGTAAVNFPGFQKIYDFISVDEFSVSFPVNSNIDLEYMIAIYSNNNVFDLIFNNDNSSIYGRQYIQNLSGTITALRGTGMLSTGPVVLGIGTSILHLLTPVGLIKTMTGELSSYDSGTIIDQIMSIGFVYNYTGNITSLDFVSMDGTAGTRITIFARRSN